ncbi:MAG TPA: penicillin-binding protein activator [Stellaceae bacterium]|nr:penicillin-binding protein activator [Stellaceae bacterium]
MWFPLRRLRGPAAALIVAAGCALAGCTIGGGKATPQPGPNAAPSTIVPAPVTATPLPPAGAAPPPAPATAPTGNKAPVALLLPLSGPSAGLGQSMLDAAQMALFDIADDRLQLLVRDTGGTAPMAAEAARSAIADGAKLILGPLLAAEVEAVKPIAQTANVPLVAFSTATQLAGNGTWLMSFDARQEIQRVVVYAHAHGRDRFATLAPLGPYGDLAVNALRDSAQIAGASMSRVARYDPAATNYGSTVQSIAAGADFDAILLAEGGAKLKALAPLLPYYGIDPDKVKLLGTGLWADSSIGTEPALEGGWYAAPAPEVRADFEKRFEALYKHAPPLLATLGYDGAALAAVLAHASPAPDFSAAALTNPSGFTGLNGIFRLLPDGAVERGLAVLEVHRTGATLIDPAPQTFQRLGY